MITHYDLFAGIGGFSLALEEVFDEPIRHIFCEWEDFPTQVLKKHWPNGEYWGDIAELVTHTSKRDDRGNARELPQEDELQTKKRQEERPTEPSSTDFTIVTGGFPCQPFSAAGRRRGTSDDRYKWPEMFAVIRNVQPDWVIAENVRGLVTWNEGMVLEQVCSDLESEGYEVQPLIIPAVAVNAPHRRDRVWIIANRPSNRRPGRSSPTKAKERYAEGYEQAGELEGRPERPYRDATNPGRERQAVSQEQTTRGEQYGWNDPWPEVAAELCGVFNGLSRELDTIMNDGLLLEYGKTFSRITGQDLPCLWEGFQSEEFQWSVGRFNTIQNKDYLFTVLWKLSKPTKAQNKLPFESKEVQEALLRNVWHNGKSGRTSQGWEYNEQYAEEHQDSLSQLSHEVALATAEIHKRYLLNRKDRLKALGNAIVPQVAIEIMKGIRYADQ